MRRLSVYRQWKQNNQLKNTFLGLGSKGKNSMQFDGPKMMESHTCARPNHPHFFKE